MSVTHPSTALAALLLLVACGEPSASPSPLPAAGSGGSANAAGSGGAAGGITAGANPGAGTGGNVGAGGGQPECDLTPASLLCAPLGKMPASIRDTGLFPAAPDLSQRSARLLEYVPDPPLWSDGMEKQRFLLLPSGQRIDNGERTRWAFPAGTIFIKTFYDDSGPAGSPRAIETRLIRAAANGTYEFYLYRWNEAGTDAELLVDDINGDITLETPVDITINHTAGGQPLVLNGGQPFAHVLPSRNACGDCHEKNGSVAQTIIGFDELRLNSWLDAADSSTQLRLLAERGVFTQPPPAEPISISDSSNDQGRLLRIKRFVFGNCVSCHNGNGNFDLRPTVFVENTVGKPTESQSVEPPEGWLRVVPGSPQTSVLYVQMQRTMLPEPGAGSRLRPMPPIGVADVAAEQTSLKDVFDWISALPP